MIILGSDQENKLLAKGGNYMELSIQIKKYRTELHLSQEELAEKVYVTRQTISNWENEKSYPDIHSLLLLSSLFNVSLDQLIKGDIEKMKEIISEQEIKKFNYYGSIYTVHLAVLIISAVPLFMWLGRYAYIPFGILFIITQYWALTTFEKLYYHMNEFIVENGFVNLDFMGNLGHSIVKTKGDRVYIEKGNMTKLGDVKYFTFEPHISYPDSKYGYKKENIYYFDENGLMKL